MDLIDMINEAWKETELQIRKEKVWWDEGDIVCLFYSILKPAIDLIPNFQFF